MYRVYACLTGNHDLRWVVVAGLICFFASFVAVSLAWRARSGASRARLAWLATAAVATGAGIWATHFVAMLAFDSGLPTGYDPTLTLLSLLLATVVTGVGLAVAVQGADALCWAGGGIIGLGVSAMHYSGMAGLRVPADVAWDLQLVALSVGLGVVFSIAAVLASFRRAGLGHRLLGAGLLALAICAMHFTGMGAITLVPNPALPLPDDAGSAEWLAAEVAAVAVAILAISLVGSAVDQRFARLKAVEAGRLQSLVNATFEGIGIHAGGTILDGNRALARLLGVAPGALPGRSLLEFVAPDQRNALLNLAPIDAAAHAEVEILRADGTRIPAELLGQKIDYFGQPACVIAIRDISERRLAEERMRHMAHHDALTGLPNRVLFADRLDQALARARRSAELVAVLCLDLDRFKEINDLHGHAAGDALLRQVAARLLGCTRELDTVARLGGDEFAIILPTLGQPEQAIQVAERLIGQLGAAIEIDGKLLSSGTSVGIALFPQNGSEAAQLLRHADIALYRAKAEGRGTCRLFEAEMDATLRDQRALEQDLRQALTVGELELHYQPQAALDSGAIIGCEALIRWHHARLGAIPPARLIALAEDSGLIVPLGEWVLRTACAEAAGWPERLRVSVNLSPVQFRQGRLPELVAEVLRASGLRPGRLELEITEAVLISEPDRARQILPRLKALGVRLAMDDFGTGYSSLSHLQIFPFDKIKIDRSFISRLDRPDAAAIVEAVIQLGRSLKVAVVAEGVETEAASAFLRAQGCDEVQGFLFGRPMPASAVRRLLHAPDHRLLSAG